MSLKLNERYPGRFSNPSADYPGGSFKNRTTPDAKDGSYLEKDWANDKEGFFQSLLSSAGITANGIVDKVGGSQFFDALQQLKQSQSGVAFTTAGTAPAFTLTPSPAISLSAPTRLRASFNASGTTGSNTINVGGTGVKNLVQFDSGGNLVPAAITGGMLSDIEYNGTSWVVLDPLPTAVTNLVGIQGAAKNLKGSATGLSAVVTYTADEVIVESTASSYQVLRAVSVTPSFANANGANGLDTGTSAASTWYSVWVIWNGTTTAGLLSLSTTAPAMPSGYTHKARVGWVRTDGTANKYPLRFLQFGRRVRYTLATGSNLESYPVAASGVQGTFSGSTFAGTSVSLSGFIPATAGVITVNISCITSTAAAGLAVNNTTVWQGWDGTLNPVTVISNPDSLNFPADVFVESMTVYFASSDAAGRFRVVGWEDNL